MSDPARPNRPERIGRYRVIDRIGRGANGIVYSAHDDERDRDVAVKVLMTDFEEETDIRERFNREAQVCLTLAHRNIVTVFDFGEDNGRPFIVMELLRGRTLEQCLKQQTLSIEEKIDVTLEVCAGLAVANAAGVRHRDVKPSNLFLQEDGGVKILDFGIARLPSSSMTAIGFILGTPDYMSPEQARGDEVDERSDIFSLGAVLYLMLTGRKPFAALTMPATLRKVMGDQPPPIEPAEAPPVLSQVVFKALSKEPSQRFATFQELSLELSRWRRHHEAETRMLAGEAARTMTSLERLAAMEHEAAAALGAPPEADLDAWLAAIAAGYPELLANGAAALRGGTWRRSDVDEISRRVGAVVAAWEPQIASLRAAGESLSTGTRQLEAGDARGALESLAVVLRHAPAARVGPLVERAQRLVAEQQARDDKVRSLLAEAAEARSGGRLDAALMLVNEALEVNPQSQEARLQQGRIERDLAAAGAERTRQCERCLERARRALQLDQLDEAHRQLDLAKQTGAADPEIAVLSATLSGARSARDAADAMIQEVAGELARARTEFDDGFRPAALQRLEALAARHPSSTAVQAELTRLRSEDQRLTAAERTLGEADRLAADAATALTSGDAAGATRLADRALALVPSHEVALKTSALAHAHAREVAERTAREAQARRLVDSARSLLERGRFDRAIKEARRAAELDPAAADAPAVIAEAFRRQAAAARADVERQEAARRAAELREVLAAANTSLRMKEFARARMLAERAVALDPDNREARELISSIAGLAALAARELDEATVKIVRGPVDPDATVVLPIASAHWGTRWPALVRLWLLSVVMFALARVRLPWNGHSVKRAAAPAPARTESPDKEA